MGFFTTGKSMATMFALPSPSRNPFQGGMGFFTKKFPCHKGGKHEVAIPFRVGWGFSLAVWLPSETEEFRRNPFQGGMGFFTN